ncbi:WXG100 family type VII secretion target [Glycomyces buryatensis]|uniref:WXG100 family type VII secretion target n=1 Tax=Glycomyces buryatensis TaxID=2570927 RepID=A0A4S8Q7M5_9ACTN|nr:WXG100 family type VII secretion target [Glycomyces buryatensis]THV40140.1 hypothetical protein FAB82_15695 [Glycomyces buryatensis]
MATSPYELYGNVGALQGLADVQHTYRGRFDGILAQIQGHVSTVQGKWVGAGTAGFASFNTESEGEFTELQAAFQRLATATEDSASNWKGAISRIDGRWGG